MNGFCFCVDKGSAEIKHKSYRFLYSELVRARYLSSHMHQVSGRTGTALNRKESKALLLGWDSYMIGIVGSLPASRRYLRQARIGSSRSPASKSLTWTSNAEPLKVAGAHYSVFDRGETLGIMLSLAYIRSF